MRLPWSGILWCPAGCPVHISAAGKTGRNSQTTKSRHCQLLTKLLWGRTSFKSGCACLVVCMLQCVCLCVSVSVCVFKTQRKTERERKRTGWTGEAQNLVYPEKLFLTEQHHGVDMNEEVLLKWRWRGLALEIKPKPPQTLIPCCVFISICGKRKEKPLSVSIFQYGWTLCKLSWYDGKYYRQKQKHTHSVQCVLTTEFEWGNKVCTCRL